MTDAPWKGGKCRVPMWSMGTPAGFCGEPAFGPQLPKKLLWRMPAIPYCHGPCCPGHGGPAEGEPIIFQDGLTDHGYPMYCAVMPGFENLQESSAGFSGDAEQAIAKLREATHAD